MVFIIDTNSLKIYFSLCNKKMQYLTIVPCAVFGEVYGLTKSNRFGKNILEELKKSISNGSIYFHKLS